MNAQRATKPPYRVSAQGLRAGEAGLLRALVTLIADDRGDGFPWVYAAHGADAVCAASADGQTLELRLRDGTALPLSRPLSAQTLERVLDQAAAQPRQATVEAAAGTDRYRLRRWPPAELLRNDRQRVRLATMLSRQPLTIDELASLSKIVPERCQTFVLLLQGFGLLTVTQPEAAGKPARAAATANARAPGRWSLVGSIRRKLGLVGDAR